MKKNGATKLYAFLAFLASLESGECITVDRARTGIKLIEDTEGYVEKVCGNRLNPQGPGKN